MHRCMPSVPVAFLSRESTELSYKESEFLPRHLSAKIHFSLVNRKRKKMKSHPSFSEPIIFHLKLMGFLQGGQVILFKQSETSAWMEWRIVKLLFSWDLKKKKKKLDSVFPKSVAVHHSPLTEELTEKDSGRRVRTLENSRGEGWGLFVYSKQELINSEFLWRLAYP